ncbi:MAG: exo-beta-N-acetylmuramidase NamZ family protein [Streptosporangiaceae bacterium]
MNVAPGIITLLDDRHTTARGPAGLRGARVALLGHAASVLPDLTPTLEALLGAGLAMVAVLGPEHGYHGTRPPGETEGPGVDPATGVPVLDAYRRPMAELLAEARPDVVIADVQHAGARFYTYESSLHDLIAACDVAGVRVIVCDRPNPVTGIRVAGPLLDPAFASFVGRAPIPLRHGMTIGELALLFARLHGVTDLVDLAPMAGWRRSAWYRDTGLPWVPPSPNLPTAASTVTYPGICLMEGTSLSAGRGTTTPFGLVGADWTDRRLASAMRALALPGVAFRAADFVPRFDRYAGQQVSGVALHVTDHASFEPLRCALEIIAAAARLWPDRLTFRDEHFDRLAGTDRVRLALLDGVPPADIAAGWAGDVAAFAGPREECLRYD